MNTYGRVGILVNNAGILRDAAFKNMTTRDVDPVISPIARTRMTEHTMPEMVKDCDPAQVTPVVVYLAHETCTRTAHIYRIGGAHVSRVFIAETVGLDDPALTPESLARTIETINDSAGFTIRGGPATVAQ
jgi:NAD(P)-dependent dehydrogenase (short-subunit alcohol dehydrogenase family)